MKKQTIDEARRCPKCGRIENQVKKGRNRSGTQRCECRECGTRYTLEPKSRTYPEEVRQQAIKTYYSGVSGRGVGALFGMGREMVSRQPRQIVGFDVAQDKSAWRIQRIVDGGPEAEKYCTDGHVGYLDVVYPGQHIRNMRDKSDTFTVEGVNADLRHYIPILARRSRCFPRSLETLQAVVEVFVDAYNRFGQAKYHHRLHRTTGSLPFALVDFL